MHEKVALDPQHSRSDTGPHIFEINLDGQASFDQIFASSRTNPLPLNYCYAVVSDRVLTEAHSDHLINKHKSADYIQRHFSKLGLKKFIKAGDAITLPESLCKTSLLSIAAYRGEHEWLEALLSSSLEVSLFPDSPLHMAISHGQAKSSGILLEHGFSPSTIAVNTGRTRQFRYYETTALMAALDAACREQYPTELDGRWFLSDHNPNAVAMVLVNTTSSQYKSKTGLYTAADKCILEETKPWVTRTLLTRGYRFHHSLSSKNQELNRLMHSHSRFGGLPEAHYKEALTVRIDAAQAYPKLKENHGPTQQVKQKPTSDKNAFGFKPFWKPFSTEPRDTSSTTANNGKHY